MVNNTSSSIKIGRRIIYLFAALVYQIWENFLPNQVPLIQRVNAYSLWLNFPRPLKNNKNFSAFRFSLFTFSLLRFLFFAREVL